MYFLGTFLCFCGGFAGFCAQIAPLFCIYYIRCESKFKVFFAKMGLSVHAKEGKKYFFTQKNQKEFIQMLKRQRKSNVSYLHSFHFSRSSFIEKGFC